MDEDVLVLEVIFISLNRVYIGPILNNNEAYKIIPLDGLIVGLIRPGQKPGITEIELYWAYNECTKTKN